MEGGDAFHKNTIGFGVGPKVAIRQRDRTSRGCAEYLVPRAANARGRYG